MVWNILSNKNGEYLLMELRDTALHQVDFAAIDLHKGEVMWQGWAVKPSWWTGLSGIIDSVGLFHVFEGGQSPDPQALIGVDILTGNILWEKPAVKMHKILPQFLQIIYKVAESEQYAKMNPLTGQITNNSVGEDELLTNTGNENNTVFYPFHYTEGSDHFKTVQDFLTQKEINAIKGCDYLEISNGIVISYYIYQNELLQNVLSIFDFQGEELFQDILFQSQSVEEDQAIGLQTFFSTQSQVIYVKNKNELIGVAIAQA